MPTCFIAGTDTEVGKTTVTVQLMQQAIAQGMRVVGIKPVSAGCVQVNGVWRNDDALQLQAASNVRLPYHQVNPVALPEPMSPHIAAARAGASVNVAGLQQQLAFLPQIEADVSLVEGAGGWYCPINDRETLADLVVASGWPVILVVAMRLGCLNMALLTARALAADGAALVGWVANSLDTPMSVYEENLQTLKRRLPAPLLAECHVGPRLTWVAPELSSLMRRA